MKKVTVNAWEQTTKEFIAHHITGYISESAYRDYATIEGLSWLGKKDRFPLKIRQMVVDGEIIEFRKNKERLQYCQMDADGNIARDPEGMALHQSLDEIIAQELPAYSTVIIVFNAKDQPIAFASDEFGCDGLWVVESYQRKGIGVKLLTDFRAQFSDRGPIGQATGAGIRLATAYHRELVKQAMQAGESIPEQVLAGFFGSERNANQDALPGSDSCDDTVLAFDLYKELTDYRDASSLESLDDDFEQSIRHY